MIVASGAPENEIIAAGLSCPRCGLEMRLFGIEAGSDKRDLFTFECEPCDMVEVRGVAVLQN